MRKLLPLVLVGACAVSCGPSPAETDSPRVPPAPRAEATHAVRSVEGAALTSGPWRVTVTGAYPLQALGVAEAGPGAVLIALVYTVTNTTADPVSTDHLPGLQLSGPRGAVIAQDADLTAMARAYPSAYAINRSGVSPGVGLKTVSIFEVAKAGFDPGAWRVRADLGDVAIALPPLGRASVGGDEDLMPRRAADTPARRALSADAAAAGLASADEDDRRATGVASSGGE